MCRSTGHCDELKTLSEKLTNDNEALRLQLERCEADRTQFASRAADMDEKVCGGGCKTANQLVGCR